ncbi:MAG: hypothetical protein BMS9Abin13_618 [Patescibacteria group bacterium]|nr:MAG: hypothetical protein BMS9Abin13_618 [Patescibacteria group bacterium]
MDNEVRDKKGKKYISFGRFSKLGFEIMNQPDVNVTIGRFAVAGRSF